MIREYNGLKLISKMLHRITTIEYEERQQLVLPAAHISTVLQALHDDMGHPGKDRTLIFATRPILLALDFSNVRKSMQTNSNGEEVAMGTNGAL
jgi:hypothetical protein